MAVSSGLTCNQVPLVADNGYLVTFSKDMKKAAVERLTIKGAKIVATLVCTTNGNKTPNYPDKMTVWNCTEPKLRDAGYSAVLKMGGFAGFRDVTLSEVTFRGSEVVAQLRCRL